MTISPRQLEEQVAHKLRYTFSYNVPGNATMNPAAGGVNFGAIPNGAVISSCDVFVTDSFNSGTSCALNVGFSIVARSGFVGFKSAVGEMRRLVD